MIRILIAEDERPIREGLSDLLSAEGYAVLTAENGEAAAAVYRTREIDLAILDIMMPKMSGYDVCREIRKKDEHLPIIFLSAKEEEIDKVVGLELGADDYIVKPFGVKELLARIRTVLRRAERTAGSGNPEAKAAAPFSFGRCSVDPARFTVTRNGMTVPISGREVKLLTYFFSRAGEVLSRDHLLDKFWGIEYGGTTRTLDQHIAKLRQKVEEDPALPRHIITVHGTGYRFSRE